MLNYLHSQWYRTVRRKYLYIALAAALALGALYLYLVRAAIGDRPIGLESGVEEIVSLTPYVGFYAILLINDGAFSDERRLGTFKNDISFGFSRETLYFGKLISCLVFCVLGMILLAVPVLGMGVLILGVRDWEIFGIQMELFGRTVLAAFPLWLCGAAAANALSCVLRKSVFVVMSYIAAFNLGNLMLQLMARLEPVWEKIRAHFPMGLLDDLSNGMLLEDGRFMARCWVMGLLFTAVFVAAGYFGFRRAEVK